MMTKQKQKKWQVLQLRHSFAANTLYFWKEKLFLKYFLKKMPN